MAMLSPAASKTGSTSAESAPTFDTTIDHDMIDHIEFQKYAHPRTFSLFDPALIRDREQLSARAARLRQIRGHSDFDDDQRGAAYRARQLAVPRSREHGDRKILEAIGKRLGGFNFRQAGLDVIGGNGTTARTAATLLTFPDVPYIIAGDPCLDMVNNALSQRLPAVWQCAQESPFADNSFDFVIGSRGFHHVPEDAREQAFSEANRILKPGGVLMVVDFEEGSPTARWYSEGLEKYTATGHQYRHFTVASFGALLDAADFGHRSVFKLYDPFRFYGASAEDVRNTLLEHVVGMFGMVKLQREPLETARDYWTRVAHIISPWCSMSPSDVSFDVEGLPRLSVIQEADGRWRAEMPRVALCAIGTKT